MPRAPWAGEAVYRAADRFIDECLRTDGSLFTPGQAIWQPDTIDDLSARLAAGASGNFWSMLGAQLEDAPPEVTQLAAEALYVQFLSEDDTHAETKEERLASLMGSVDVAVPADLREAFGGGLAAIGAGASQRRLYLRFLLTFSRAWKASGGEERDRLLADAWGFREFVRGIVGDADSIQAEALIHLVFPDPFEPIVSRKSKRDVVERFAGLPGVADAVNLDRKLEAVRNELGPILGASFTFYRSSLRRVWGSNESATWREYAEWARRLLELPSFDSEERDYKLEIASNVAAARDALVTDDWLPALRRAFGSPNNVTHWREFDPFLKWAERDPEPARQLLHGLWNGDYHAELRGALRQIPTDVLPGRAARTSIASYLLLGVDPTRFPIFRHQVYERTCKLVGRPLVAREANVAELYDDFVELLVEIRLRLLARGIQTRDLLDAQSVAWWISSTGPPDEWSDEDKRAFLAFREGAVFMNGPTQAWLVRGEKAFDNNLVPRWLSEGFVSFGSELDLGIVPGWTRPEIAEHISGYNETMGSKPDTVHRFVTKMQSGDLLLTVDGDDCFLGLVSGEVVKDEDAEPGAVIRRTAEWLNRGAPVSRSDLPESVKRLMKPPTVIDMTAAGPELAQLVGLEWGGIPLKTPDGRSDATLLPRITAELAAKVHFDVEPLQEIADLLEEKKQLVFYGPPGTGKTLVAQRLAEHLTSAGGDWHLAQFHPSYSYEDFIEGFRPVVSGDNGVAYALKPGPLRRIAEDARDDPDNPYILIVDEINRGNIPKIFGELLFLLEYRDRAIELQYADEPFSLPSNLFLIGTMNTADRSIALVDAALRRRFYFIPFLPQEEPVKLVLRRWLVDRERDDDLPARLLDLLNERIAKDEVSIGPSYLMAGDGSHASLTRIWRYAILPLLEEHYYGSGHDVVKEFGLSALLARLQEEARSEDVEQVEQR